MSDFIDRISKLPPKRLALLALDLHDEVEALKQRASEPVAVIGIGCRFPGGANSPDQFWTLLEEGRDAIREVPRERWDIDAFFNPDPDAAGRMSVRNGGFLDEISLFDAPFFGIAPREALTMDPQQRLLLEVAWEALEQAGLSADRLAGSPTGVFVGICNSDHFQRLIDRGADEIDAYLASGNAHSVAAGRIAYCLGLNGPALAIDTACSSSLVALHAACRSLRSGETRLALAGGVNVMCAPETTVALSKAHMLAPDGRCKTFDAAADGFSRGEGCGVLVLKRLADALADQDRVLAVIRGTATNQDGRSGGLTVPSGPAQEAVIRAALADARLAPADIDYVEAHGTGTSLGDPIEVRALAHALGEGRDAQNPLVVGSVKTNIGHLESAAGIAGVIKVILSLQHERIPAHLHFRKPSPHIPWSEFPVTVPQQARDWRRGERRRIAGVSSFGFSGTNAHVLIEEAPQPAVSAPALTMPVQCLPLSARSDRALADLAARYDEQLAAPGASLDDIAATAGTGRAQFTQRLAVVADTMETARAALKAHIAGTPHPALHTGTAVPGQPPDVVFLFPGQGSQYPGMGRRLYDASPVFREVIDRCDAALGTDARGRTLLSVLRAAPDDEAIHDTAWTQPALFAVEYGLAQLWRSWGIEPAAVIGHSVGEYVAACVAGVFSPEDGVRLIAERGRLMASLPPGGRMAAVFASEARVAAALVPFAGRVAIAAINAPESVVISGEAEAVDAVLAHFAREEVRGQTLFVSFAAHSPLVEPALDAMEACARGVAMQAPRIPVAWNVTGGAALPGDAPDAVYWRRHLREPVRFADGIRSLYDKGYRTFLDVGPHPTLMALAQQPLPEDGAALFASLRRDKDDWQEIVASLAGLYVRGAPVDWDGVHRPYAHRRVALPTYPFERKRYWVTPSPAGATRRRAAPAGAHPLVGWRLPTAVPVFEIELTAERPAYLADHRVHGEVLVAGPVFLEMAQACAKVAFGGARDAVADFVIRQPLVLREGAARLVQTTLNDAGDDALSFLIASRAADNPDEAWITHAAGRLADGAVAADAPESLAAVKARLGPATDGADFYRRLATLGIDLAGRFRSIGAAHTATGEALVRIELPAGCEADAVAWAHPALLDGAMQACGLATPETTGDIYLLSAVKRIALPRPLPPALWCHARLRDPQARDPQEWLADVVLRDDAGAVIGEVAGVCLRRAPAEALARAVGANAAGLDDLFYRVDWQEAPLAEPAQLAGPCDIAPAARHRFAELAEQHGLAVYDELLPELDRLSVAHSVEALRDLGVDMTEGHVFGNPLPSSKLILRLLDILIEEGVLRRRGERYEVARAPAPIDLDARYNDLLKRFNGTDAELKILRRCGSALGDVLAGRQDPLQLLFPNGSLTEARQLYVESPFARTYNTALADALAAAVTTLPKGRRLRVLEIGAGTGGTTSYVLPRLDPDKVDYTFTDISPLFLERAAAQFDFYPSLQCRLLDIERDPAAQGFARAHYDVVIAANVLHATADLRQTLAHVRGLLAPDGLLFLLEGVAPERWVDLTFGMTPGWWRFTDAALRPDYPLIDTPRWLELLEAEGFGEPAAVPGENPASRAQAQQRLIVARAVRQLRHWALIGERDGVGAALAHRLTARGDAVTVLDADASAPALPDCDEVVYLGALELADIARDDAAALTRAKSLSCGLPLRWLGQVRRADPAPRVWLVTAGAQSAQGQQRDGARWQAPLWGVGRVFALEQPDRFGGLIDLPPDGDAAHLADLLLASVERADGEEQTAWRGDRRLAARLDRVPAPARQAVTLRPDATYLVTGGFGGLGPLVAQWLAERGARHLALIGRHPDPDLPALRAIAATGARIIALAGDLADEAAMRTVFASLANDAPPLRGIVHAAAGFGTGAIGDITPAEVDAALRAKLDGTLMLERLTRDMQLDFVALFSSSTAVLGAAGFAGYAAANLFLDATAQTAPETGPHVVSVNWGTWEAMRLASQASQQSFREAGLTPMPAAEAFDALERLLAGGERQAMVARIDWGVLRPLHEARRARPLLSRLETVRPSARAEGSGKATAEAAPGLIDTLAKARPEARHDLIVGAVTAEVAAVLGLGANDAISPEMGLFEMGMDSLMSVELKRRLERLAGRSLPATLTFNYPNVVALAGFLSRELGGADAAPKKPPVELAPLPADENLDELDDDELEARLAARLEMIR